MTRGMTVRPRKRRGGQRHATAAVAAIARQRPQASNWPRARSVVAARDEFLGRVWAHLFGEPSDASVSAAVNAELDAMTAIDGTNK